MFVVLAFGLLACQEPFGTDRHQLEGFRIAALRAPAENGVVRPEAVIIDQGNLWTDEAADLRWYRVADSDAAARLAADSVPDAEGPQPELPDDGSLLALVATSPSGETRTAVVAPHAPAPAAPGIRIRAVDALRTSTLTAAQLDLGYRRDLVAVETENPADDAFLRVDAEGVDGALLRWMGKAGTFFELGDATTDWAPADVTVDDDEVTVQAPVGEGLLPVLGLALWNDGAVAWGFADIVRGPEVIGLSLKNGRFLPADQLAGEEVWLEGTVIADAASPSGVRLVETVGVEPPLEADAVNEALPCTTAVNGPFDPEWLATQRCTRAQIVGHRVLVEVRP